MENAGIDITTILDIAVPVKGRMIHERGDTRSSLYDVKYRRVRFMLIVYLLLLSVKHNYLRFTSNVTIHALKRVILFLSD